MTALLAVIVAQVLDPVRIAAMGLVAWLAMRADTRPGRTFAFVIGVVAVTIGLAYIFQPMDPAAAERQVIGLFSNALLALAWAVGLAWWRKRQQVSANRE